MRKIIVALLLVSSFSFASSSVEIDENQGCFNYATQAATAEYEFYGGMTEDELSEAGTWYYQECLRAGGAQFMAAPVFI